MALEHHPAVAVAPGNFAQRPHAAGLNARRRDVEHPRRLARVRGHDPDAVLGHAVHGQHVQAAASTIMGRAGRARSGGRGRRMSSGAAGAARPGPASTAVVLTGKYSVVFHTRTMADCNCAATG